jgi:hypothetical protein
MFTYVLSDLLLLAVGSLVVFVLREYILKVHVLVSSEHKLCQKYKRESKARMLIKYYCLFFVNCDLFSFLNIKRIKIYNENTVADGNVLC